MVPMRVLRVMAAVCLWGVVCGSGAQPSPGEPTGAAAAAIPAAAPGRGTAVAIGGGLKPGNRAVWERLVALAGGQGARFVVLGTASENPLGSAKEAAALLEKHGARAAVLPVSPLLKDAPVAEAVRDPKLLAEVDAAGGVFFTGGAQDRIVDSLVPGGRDSPLMTAIRRLQQRGGVVAGTSAGAAIMSELMFRDAPNVLAVLRGRMRAGQEIGPGLGFGGPDLFVDQHFLKRGRFGRMIPVMQAHGYTLGLGVEEDSAALLRGDEIEMIAGKAVLVDLAPAVAARVGGAFGLQGAQLSLLEAGDRYVRSRRELRPSAEKLAGQRLDPAAPGYKPYYTEAPFYADMLAEGVLGTAMALLIDGSFDAVEGLAFDPRPAADDPLAALGFAIRLYKGPGSVGWYSEASGGEDYTVHRLRLDIRPVRIARPFSTPWTGP